MKSGLAFAVGSVLLGSPIVPAKASDDGDRESDSPRAPLSVEQPEEGHSYYYLEAHTSRDWSEGLIGAPDLLRRAEPVTKAERIWKLTDIAIANRFLSTDQPKIRTEMKLEIDGNGRVIACQRSDREDADLLLAAEACPVIKERMRFKPALGLNGKPAADRYRYSLSFVHRKQSVDDERPRAFQAMLFGYWMGPPPDATDADDWPIVRAGYPGFRLPKTTKPLMSPPYEPWYTYRKVAGVAISRAQGGEQNCHVVVPSDSEEFNQLACDFLISNFDPQLALTSSYRVETFPFLIAGEHEPEFAIAPKNRRAGKTARLKPDSAEATLAAIETMLADVGGKSADIKFALSLDDRGNPTDCRVDRSSGSGAGDYQACKVVMKMLRFEAAIDIFGRRAISRRVSFRAAPIAAKSRRKP